MAQHQQLSAVALDGTLTVQTTFDVTPLKHVENTKETCIVSNMKRTNEVKEEEVIRATPEEVNIQYASVRERCGTGWILRCSSGWPQNSTVRIFTDSCEAFEYGLYLKKEG